MHPISLSLLHSPHTAPITNPFYSSAANSSASSGSSPVKRPRPSNNNGPPSNHSASNNNNMEEWLPSPGQMSVDSMSPQPPPVPASSGVQLNGLSTPSVISSSGYSPSPMSTGSYEPPFSPGGASKLGESLLHYIPSLGCVQRV